MNPATERPGQVEHASNSPAASLEREMRELLDLKKQCARAIGVAKKTGQTTGALMAEMQAITGRLKSIETKVTTRKSSFKEHAAVESCPTTESRPTALFALDFTIPLHELQTTATTIDQVPDWQEFVDSHPRASIYHDARWPKVLSDAFGHEHYALACRHGRQLVGVLPLLHQKSRLFGDFLTSLPFVNYGGALGLTPSVEQSLMHHAAALGERVGCGHVEFRDVHARDGWSRQSTKVAMVLTLPVNAQDLWQSVGSKVRAQVRRPEREGAKAIVGGAELLSDFYSVFSRNMRDLGTPVYSRRWFELLCERFQESVAIAIVELGGRPVSAGFLLRHREIVEIPWASTLREFNHFGVNMQLYWQCLKWAIENGATRFDFGRSSLGAGTHRFKAQWGANEVPLHWHYWLRPGQPLPQLNPTNARYQLAIAAWKRLPLPIANLVGPRIVKFLP